MHCTLYLTQTLCFVNHSVSEFGRGGHGYSKENIGEVFFNAWKNSAGHNRNMLRGDAHCIGIGIVKDSSGTWWATQIIRRERNCPGTLCTNIDATPCSGKSSPQPKSSPSSIPKPSPSPYLSSTKPCKNKRSWCTRYNLTYCRRYRIVKSLCPAMCGTCSRPTPTPTPTPTPSPSPSSACADVLKNSCVRFKKYCGRYAVINRLCKATCKQCGKN